MTEPTPPPHPGRRDASGAERNTATPRMPDAPQQMPPNPQEEAAPPAEEELLLPEHPPRSVMELLDTEPWEDDQDALRVPDLAQVPDHGLYDLAVALRSAIRQGEHALAEERSCGREAARAAHLLEAFMTVTRRDLPLREEMIMPDRDPAATLETVQRVLEHSGHDLSQEITHYERWRAAEDSLSLDGYFRITAELEELQKRPDRKTHLTQQRALTLALLHGGLDEHGKPWSMRSLGERIGLSKATVQQLIERGRRQYQQRWGTLPLNESASRRGIEATDETLITVADPQDYGPAPQR